MLQRIGIDKCKAKDEIYRGIRDLFYKKMQEANDWYCDESHFGWVDAVETMDVFDETLVEYFSGKRLNTEGTI